MWDYLYFFFFYIFKFLLRYINEGPVAMTSLHTSALKTLYVWIPPAQTIPWTALQSSTWPTQSQEHCSSSTTLTSSWTHFELFEEPRKCPCDKTPMGPNPFMSCCSTLEPFLLCCADTRDKRHFTADPYPDFLLMHQFKYWLNQSTAYW